MKKILFTAHVDSHILHFHIPYIKFFKERGFEVHVASNGESTIPYVDFKYNVPFNRLPYHRNNLKAFKIIRDIIKKNKYTLIHCNTPVGGAITRLAAIDRKKLGTKIIYTAHGFHFFKGASLYNWLIYFPVEYFLSHFTDCLITINDEDFMAVKEKFKANTIVKIDGVGVNLTKFKPLLLEEKKKLRNYYGFNEEDFVLVYTAELSYRKNQGLLIDTINLLKTKIPDIKLLLIGDGSFEKDYRNKVNNLGLQKNVIFLGYQKDVYKYLSIADIAVSSSRQEGLPLNILEAMATGLPLVVTNCRGNRDLVTDGKNGFIVELNDIDGFAKRIFELYKSKFLRNKFREENLKIINKYSLQNILPKMEEIYNTTIKS